MERKGALLVRIESGSTTDASRCIKLTEFEEPVEYRAVLPHIEPLQLTKVLVHVIRRDGGKEIDVVV